MDTVDDFDELPALRRRLAALEQANGDLGETIGVLKLQRARLWTILSDTLAPLQDAQNQLGHREAARVFIAARDALKEIKIN